MTGYSYIARESDMGLHRHGGDCGLVVSASGSGAEGPGFES